MRTTWILLCLLLAGCVPTGPLTDDDDSTAAVTDDDDSSADDDDTSADDDDATADDDDATGDDDDATPPPDVDNDGVPADGPDGVAGTADDDCDDLDPTVHPGAPEVCDGQDNDCDGVIPADEVDGDLDGIPACLDCDDTAASAATTPFATVLSPATCEALAWTVAQTFFSAQLFLDAVEQDLASVGPAPCPAYSTMTDTTNPTACTLWPNYELTTETWTGDCTGTDHSVVGGVTRVYELEECDVFTNASDVITATGFEALAVAGAPLAHLALDGQLSDGYSGSFDASFSSSYSDSLMADVWLDGPATSRWPAGLIPEGHTTFAVTRSAFRPNTPSEWQYHRENRSTDSVAHADTTPWVTSGSVAYEYHDLMMGSGDPSCVPEPLTGSLSVELLDAPGGSITATAEVQFDGVNACDGCGDVYEDGVFVGSVCSDVWWFPLF